MLQTTTLRSSVMDLPIKSYTY